MTAPVVIVGAGPAGCAAAVQCVRLGLPVRLLDRTGRAGGLVENAWRMENLPGTGGPVSGPDFIQRLRNQLDDFDIPVERFAVHSIRHSDGGAWTITSNDEGVIETSHLLVATGTRPIPLGLPGEEALAAAGRLCYEVRAVGEPTTVLVVGAGEAGLDYALGLAERGCRVTVLTRGGTCRARGRLPEMAEATPGIDLRFRRRPVALARTGDGISVTCEDGEVFRAGKLLVAVGRESNLPKLPEPPPRLLGDAARGSLGQAGIAIGDGIAAAQELARSWEYT